MSEVIEDPRVYKYHIDPDRSNKIFDMYKKTQELFWVEEELDIELKTDAINWPNIDPKIKHLIVHQVAFFLIGDGRVNQTISDHIDSRIKDRELQTWYNFQKMMEDIHNITYVKLADAYVSNAKERKIVFNAVENYPVIRRKIEWLKKWLSEGNDLHRLEEDTVNELKKIRIFYNKFKELNNFIENESKIIIEPEIFKRLDEPKATLGNQIFVNVIMEGLFFQGSFCIIFWFNHTYNGKLPGLVKANEFISRDEGLHTAMGIYIYNNLIKNRLTQDQAHLIMSEAVDIETDFMTEALPSDLLNMNVKLMNEYIKFIADQLLVEMKYEKIYNVSNPFKFMEKQSMSVRMSDFFMITPTEYGSAKSNMNLDQQELNFSEDF